MRSKWLIVPSALVVRLIASCAGDEVIGNIDPGPVTPLPPESEAGVGDASILDVVAADVAPRDRSVDGWFHTTVPTVIKAGLATKLVLQDVWSSGTEAFAVAATGQVLRYSGTEWVIEHTAEAALSGVWGLAADDLWAVGANGLVLHRAISNGSPTWSVVPIPTESNLFSIWGSGPTDLWIAAADGLYRSSVAFGAPTFAFKKVDVPAGILSELSGFHRVLGSDPGNIWFTGPEPCEDPGTQNCVFEESRVIRYGKTADGGARWSRVPLVRSPFIYPQVVGVGVASSNVAFVLGNDVQGGTGCYVSDPMGADAGIAWLGNGVCSYNRSLWMRSETLGWAVGRGGLAQEWNGTSWRAAQLTLTLVPLGAQLHAVKGSRADAPGDVWIVGEGVALRKLVQ